MREKRNRIFGQGAKIFIITITGCVALGLLMGGIGYFARQSEMETRADEDLRAIAPNYDESIANPADSIDSNSNNDSNPTAYQTKEDKIGWSGKGDGEEDTSSGDLPEVYQRELKPGEVGAQGTTAGAGQDSDQQSGKNSNEEKESDQASAKKASEKEAKNSKDSSKKKDKKKAENEKANSNESSNKKQASRK